MKNTYQEQHQAQITRILAAVPKENAKLREFARQFYAKMLVVDLEHIPAGHGAALAKSAFEFMQTREAAKPKIRIFMPKKRGDGYESKHAVIELLGDDKPFLIDSLSAELTRQGFTIHETIHPVFRVRRDAKGTLTALLAKDEKGAASESLIHFEISALPEGLSQAQLKSDLEAVLAHIHAAVSDWQAIVAKAKNVIKELDARRGDFDAATVAEVKDFLQWLLDRNFIFLGYAGYDFYDTKGNPVLAPVPGSKLGVLTVGDEEAPRGLEALPAEWRAHLLLRALIEITKSNRRSVVHRSVPMDYIGVKRFDAKGKIIGEARFLGLFTSNVYYQSAGIIPFARQKMAQVLELADFDPNGHDGKSLKTILEFLPRDEIFQMSVEDLFEVGMGILALEAKPGVRIFVRKDAFERFVSIMVFVPRERFSTELRHQIQSIVDGAFHGTTTAFSTQITETPLARLHLTVKTTPGQIPSVDIAALEQRIAKRAYLWGDLLREALAAKYGSNKAEPWARRYAAAFPQNYLNFNDATAAAYDIKKIEEALAEKRLVLDLFHTKGEDERFWHLKIYHPNEEIALSDILPLLENAGFRVIEEHPFQIAPLGLEAQVWIRDFKLEATGTLLEERKILVEEALLRTWLGDMENDRLGALVQKAGLSWRQVTLIRTYAKYLKQIGFTYGLNATAQAFLQHPDIAKNIVALFEARFSLTEKNRDTQEKSLREAIEKQLLDVSSASEDKILRRYAEVIGATLRTNYFQKQDAPVLSFKLNSAQVPDLPKPCPYAEIFVYGVRVEGIHLRGGKVARGGLRWSDRSEDFRTEVLGLMKAQMVKNAVIVPVGSKGGFIVKRPPVAREAFMEEGIACYKLYLSGLLDITDNIVKGKVAPPKNVVRYDGDDPYLVVAADKGTASFSDIANGVAEEYGFWLGDAFASGGTCGYDHKAMAITARGGWISVTRHFREMGVDIEKQEFTCTGIGDMSGDVFGNAMLLSGNVKLVAAFNHVHIFLDPNPDAKKSLAERKRLFKLPRSGWKDYDQTLISKGGGVFDRSAKSIAISKEAQAVLGIGKASLAPDDLIRAILLAPVDLLWNGGIGTYVKAEDESNEQVGDRANNVVRVNGSQLRCKVVGEGGNLGFTQKGRIEYARQGVQGVGGRINTDAIDNSGGVDCSDHEVNIKIALSHEVSSGRLTLPKRNKLLSSMTEDVAQLVLKDNFLQTQAITIAQQLGSRLLDSQERLMASLEKRGLLDRALEFLPSDKQTTELKTARKGLTRPEIAVLLAYAKMALYQDLLETSLPDEDYFRADLERYFPKAMRKEFSAAIEKHALKREIIATVMTNSLVNRAGIAFCFNMQERLNASVRDVAAAYAIARDAFSLRPLWNAIEAAGENASVQASMYGVIYQFLERVIGWLLRHQKLPLDIDAIIQKFAPFVPELMQAAKTPVEQVAHLARMAAAPDIIEVAQKSRKKVAEVGGIYFAIGEKLGFDGLYPAASNVAAGTHWEKLAAKSITNDLYDEQRRLTESVVTSGKPLDAWMATHAQAAHIERLQEFLAAIKSSPVDLPKLLLALKHLRAL